MVIAIAARAILRGSVFLTILLGVIGIGVDDEHSDNRQEKKGSHC